ncbi:hypothetical protein AX774_g3376, partial [Zancudomyces culisetae]
MKAFNEGLVKSKTRSLFEFSGCESGLVYPVFKRLSPKGFGMLFWFKVKRNCSSSKNEGTKTASTLGPVNMKNITQTLVKLVSPDGDSLSVVYEPGKSWIEIKIYLHKTRDTSTIVCVDTLVNPDSWYSFALSYSAPKKSWTSGTVPSLVIHINGKLAHSSSIEFMNNGCFSLLSIGTSVTFGDNSHTSNSKINIQSRLSCFLQKQSEYSLNSCFRGVMSSFWMFEGKIEENKVATWHKLGPYLSTRFEGLKKQFFTSNTGYLDFLYSKINPESRKDGQRTIKDSENSWKPEEFDSLFDGSLNERLLLCLQPDLINVNESTCGDLSVLGWAQSISLHYSTINEEL